MDWAKLMGVAMVVFGEVKEDFSDGKLTVDEIIETTKTVVDKLGYGDKAILNFSPKK